jgi:thiosulfate/3-mercaptopyruvate sulfurtransferase
MSGGFAHPEYLVEPAWVADHLGDPDLRVFDCTTILHPDPETTFRVESGRARWAESHVPGSDHLDLQGELSDRASRFRFTLPSAEQFAEAMGRHGVSGSARVVLYSAGGPIWATRIWWMLRAFGFDHAAVMDGGWERWTAEGRPVSAEPCRYPPARFVARPRPHLIATKDEVRAAMDDAGTRTLNALSAKQHTGEGGVHYGRPGRIPGSGCVPSVALLERGSTLYRQPDELREILAEAGAAPDRKVITYCGGGIAASSVAFVLALLGHDRVALYDGSLSEWVADPALPMEVGPMQTGGAA